MDGPMAPTGRSLEEDPSILAQVPRWEILVLSVAIAVLVIGIVGIIFATFVSYWRRKLKLADVGLTAGLDDSFSSATTLHSLSFYDSISISSAES